MSTRKMKIDFDLLSDEDHAIADLYNIPIQRVHPKAKDYQDGFIQPAVFGFSGEDEIFSFIQKPTVLNLWGAAGRPSPQQILEAVQERISR